MTLSMTRRQFLCWGSAGLLTGYGFGLEPNIPRLTRHRFESPGVPSGRSVRFVQLTDLHIGRVGYLEREAARIVREQRPDFVVVTGDACNRPEDLEELGRFFALLGGVPVYGVPGNWEHKGGIDFGVLDRIYRARGGRLLVDQTLTVTCGASRVLLTGFDNGPPDLARGVAGAQPLANHLFLAHLPATRDRLLPQLARRADLQPALLLAGHTHGGQITLFGFAPYLPSGSGRYCRGWYGHDRLHMYVSRGLGTTAIPARFMAPPEISLFDWHLAREREGGEGRP